LSFAKGSSGYHFLPTGKAFGRVQSCLKRYFLFS
jgi:hypothetical protein